MASEYKLPYTAKEINEKLNKIDTHSEKLLELEEEINNKPTDTYVHPESHPASMIDGLSTVATSGSYNDLSDKPTIPSAYTHPTTSGYKHIPSGGESGQGLIWSSNGTAKWGAVGVGINGKAKNSVVLNSGDSYNAQGDYSCHEGCQGCAIGNYSHVEGYGGYAKGNYSHVEGYSMLTPQISMINSTPTEIFEAWKTRKMLVATGSGSHAEGNVCFARGNYSHAEGSATYTSGTSSHAEGSGTIASSEAQHAQGKYNIEDTNNKYAHIVGNGSSSTRSNAHTLDWNGNAWFAGDVYIGGTNQYDATKLEIYPEASQENAGLMSVLDKSRLGILWDWFVDYTNYSTQGLAYSLKSDNTYECTGIGTATDIDIYIPSEYQGIAVTSVGYRAFRENTLIKSIVISGNITSIGEGAFSYCSSLTSITIPDSVTKIDDSAFYECSSLSKVYISNMVSWCNINFVSSYTNPLRYAKNLYLNGELVTDLVIPEGVTKIKPYAFYGCNSIKSVTIPDGVTDIRDSAFSSCTSLTSITISDSVTSITNRPFSQCSSLKTIIVSEGNTVYASIDGVLFNKNKTKLIQMPEGIEKTSYVIPDGVTSIDFYAFYNCTSLTSVTIPDGVTSIGSNAFYNCTSLTNMTIPDSVTSIDSSAFSYCTSLTNIIIPDSVTKINSYTFSNCKNLTNVVIPDGVTSIGYRAFTSCTSLISVVIPVSVTSINEDVFGSCKALVNVYYKGTEEQWAAITIGDNNTYLNNATKTYNYVGS